VGYVKVASQGLPRALLVQNPNSSEKSESKAYAERYSTNTDPVIHKPAVYKRGRGEAEGWEVG